MSSQKTNNEDHSSGKSSDFRFFKNSSLQGLVSPKLSEQALESLQGADVLLEKSELEKDSRSTTAGAIELDGQKYFLKRYNNKDLKRKLKNSVRQTRPFKVLKTAQTLKDAGIFTPEVYAALNYRRGLLLKSSYLLSEFLHSAQTAGKVFEKLVGEKNLEIFLDKISQALVKIHDAGIIHGDIKISNIIIYPNDNDSYDIGFLDLDSSRCYPEALPEKRRSRDLARLISSYFLTCKNRDLEAKALDVLIESFAAKYCDISGIDLRGDRLTQRTEYLSSRVRKK
jgi:tRNA A-37 threonylcarbamoyl transferase component Bud32